MRKIAAVLGASIALTGLGQASASAHIQQPPKAHAGPGAQRQFSLGLYSTVISHFGWYPPKTWKAPPQAVISYLAWGEAFPTAFAELAHKHGAEVLAELQPSGCDCGNVTLQHVTDGKYDSYLKQIARAVHAFGHPVQMTFAHEMNGNWYPWGYEHYTPKEWVAAWDHVYHVIHPIAPNAAWVWAPNTQFGARPVTPYWPGAGTVNAVGVDCYIAAPGQTFASQCASTIAAIRKLTGKPISIAETGVSPAANRPARIISLFDAVRAAGLTGVDYFDRGQFTLHAAGQEAVVKATNGR